MTVGTSLSVATSLGFSQLEYDYADISDLLLYDIGAGVGPWCRLAVRSLICCWLVGVCRLGSGLTQVRPCSQPQGTLPKPGDTVAMVTCAESGPLRQSCWLNQCVAARPLVESTGFVGSTQMGTDLKTVYG